MKQYILLIVASVVILCLMFSTIACYGSETKSTYTNWTAGYSFDYPSCWVPDERITEDYPESILIRHPSTEEMIFMGVFVIEKVEPLALEDAIELIITGSMHRGGIQILSRNTETSAKWDAYISYTDTDGNTGLYGRDYIVFGETSVYVLALLCDVEIYEDNSFQLPNELMDIESSFRLVK